MASPPPPRNHRTYCSPTTTMSSDVGASQSPSDQPEGPRCPRNVPETFHLAIYPHLEQDYEEEYLQKTVQILLRNAHAKYKQNPEGRCPREVSKDIWTTVKEYPLEEDLLRVCAGYVRSSHQHWTHSRVLLPRQPAWQETSGIFHQVSVPYHTSRPQIAVSTEARQHYFLLDGTSGAPSQDSALTSNETIILANKHPGNGQLSRYPAETLPDSQRTDFLRGVSRQSDQTSSIVTTQDSSGDMLAVGGSPKLNSRRFECHWCSRVVGGLPNIKIHLSTCEVLGIRQTWRCASCPTATYHKEHQYKRHHFTHHHVDCGVNRPADCPHAEDVLQESTAQKLAYGCGVCQSHVEPRMFLDHLKQHYKEAHERGEGRIPWTYDNAFRGLLRQPLLQMETQAIELRGRPYTIQDLLIEYAQTKGYFEDSLDGFIWIEGASPKLHQALQCEAQKMSKNAADRLASAIFWFMHPLLTFYYFDENPIDNAHLDYSNHLSPANALDS